MKKKIVALFVCIAMVATLAGCASSSSASTTTAPTETPVVTVEKEEPAPEVKEPEVVVEPEVKEPEAVEEVKEPEPAEPVVEETVEEEPEDPNADLGIAVDYMNADGVLDLEKYCTEGLGAQKFYMDDEMFCFVFDDAWFAEGTLVALHPSKFGVAIGSWETQSNKASFVHVGEYIETIDIGGSKVVPRDVIRLLPSVVEYMKESQDPKTQPSIRGMNFQPWPEDDPYLATFKNL
ncbi:hypothetical protein J6W91_01240 [Candidatus Saccharibacteria bacterium]|nr:hypothetical protein [Candidatus Saccharibacteria bacterium]